MQILHKRLYFIVFSKIYKRKNTLVATRQSRVFFVTSLGNEVPHGDNIVFFHSPQNGLNRPRSGVIAIVIVGKFLVVDVEDPLPGLGTIGIEVLVVFKALIFSFAFGESPLVEHVVPKIEVGKKNTRRIDADG